MQQKTKSRFPAIRPDERQAGRASADERKNGAARHPKARLDRQAKLLLVVNGLFVTANALSGTFVNVYLWKVRSEFAPIAWFALATHITGALTFWLAGSWVKRHNKMNSLRLGVAVSAMFYLLVLLLGTKAIQYVALLGIVQGMASGFFWLAFNVVYFEITERDNRDLFNGWAGLLGSGAGMIAPWISGFLITRMPDTAGYRLIFAMSLAVFVIGVVFSFFLQKRKAQGDYSWLFVYRCLRDDRRWRFAGAALVAQGLREGVFGFIIGLLVYISTKSEMTLGNYSLITSAVGLVSFLLVGKLLKPPYRKWGMLAGATVMVGVILAFFWQVSFVTLLIFGVAVALVYPLFSIPMTSTVFDLIGTNEESARKRVEFVVLREFALDAGRMIGVLVFLVVVSISPSPVTLNWLMLAIGSSPLVAWIFMQRLFRDGLPAKETGPLDGRDRC